MGKTTITVSDETADELHARKGRGESYDDVIQRLLEEPDPQTPSTISQPAPASTEREPPSPTSSDRSFSEVVDEVASEVLPGRGAKFEQRREAFLAVIDYLQAHGSMTPADAKTEIYPDHPAQYTSGQDPAHSWWNNAMYPALSTLADRSDQIDAADSSGQWKFAQEGDR